MKHKILATAVLAALSNTHAPAFANDVPADGDIERITVTADFREVTLDQNPSSISILDNQRIQDEGGEHFEDLLHNIPNLNWAGGSSRPRFFQIRGVGEVEEYQGAPNTSVGFVVDDIDLSGLGMAASMFDLQQVEVLRGPQSTRFGANALAGSIYVKSNAPTDTPEYGAEVSAGEEDLRTYAGYASGPINNEGTLLYRVSVQQHEENGFRDNAYLGKDDTNERDELTLKGKLRWEASDDFTADLSLLYVDYDNGYDAWTLDNNGFTTLTDEPGVDTQETKGASLKLNWAAHEAFDLVSITSAADTDHRHAYDGDWANPEYWASRECTAYDENWNPIGVEPCVYDYLWDKDAERTTYTQEFRLLSTEASRIFNQTTDWLVGVYASYLDEENDLDSFYNGWPDVLVESEYDATHLAAFAQLDSDLADDLILSVGARVERREADYDDDSGESFDPSETMWGGHLSLRYLITDNHEVYGRLARGYKAGGFNMGLPDNLSNQKEFDTETLYNAEAGVKGNWLDQTVFMQLSVFYMQRDDQQVDESIQDPDNPQRFFLFTSNAAESSSYGLELEGNWLTTDNLTLYGSLGLLETEFDDYLAGQSDGSQIDKSGRSLAHAPRWQYTLGGTWRHDQGWFANLNVSGSDAYYYSDSHDERSDVYHIVNTRLGYEQESWSIYAWGRNLFDEEYAVRGFYFGNEPDLDWAPKLYERYGDPQQFGVTFRYDFY